MPTAPKKMMFELSSICNYRCVGCPNPYLNRGNGHMPSDFLFKAFMDVGNKLEKAFLWLYGESLLNPNIEEILTGIKNYSAKKILSTNGWGIVDFQDISFLSSLDVLVISINGITKESYAFHQKGGGLCKVLNGAKRVGNELRDSSTILAIQTVVNKKNIEDIEKIREFSEENGFDEFVLKSFNVMDGSKKTFERFVPEGTKYSRYEKNQNKSSSNRNNYPCLNGMALGFNGEVFPCCYDYNGQIRLGNLKQQEISEIWNSQKSKDFRRKIKNGKFLEMCTDCSNNSRIIKKWIFTDKERKQNGNQITKR